jgi:hypothetical protein
MSINRFGSFAVILAICSVAACKPNEGAKTTKADASADSAGGGAEKKQAAETVTPDSVAALKRMSTYLTTLKTAQVTSKGSLDVVTEAGQRIQLDGVTNYKLRKPGFVIDYDSDLKKRRFIYDGKTFTVYAPNTGFYATVPAPPTNKETLAEIYKKRGVALPLEDLFRWADAGQQEKVGLKSGYQVGTATIDGVETDHYAFRERDSDWEVWIQQGDQPLPRKVVIVDRTDEERPTFTANLSWKVNPPLTNADFTFVPGADAKRIPMASYLESGDSK